jgi:hypothetical protein
MHPSARHAGSSWALLVVISVHLLTTAGLWLAMDEAEYLFAAERLARNHTFTLAEAGSGRLARVPWVPVEPSEPVRFRMQPLTPVALAPLVALDLALGFGGPERAGLLAHMLGHILVFAALAILALTLRVAGASERASAFAVAATGLSWPIWHVSRRGGAEPVLIFLVALFLLGGELVRRRGRGSGVYLQCLALLLLPWAHATGPLIGLVLLMGEALYGIGPRHRKALWVLLLALTIGEASFIGVWNVGYHGNWWGGGYGSYYASRPMLGVRAFLPGLVLHLGSLGLEGPVVLLVAAAALRARPLEGYEALARAALLSLAISVFFATFHQPEPTRRLAVAWPAWGLAAGLAFDRIASWRIAPRVLVLVAGLVSFHWFLAVDGRHYLGPGGLFYPSVLWIRQLLELGASAATLAPPLALALLLVVAALRLGRMLGPSPS